jgi:hypothetical protein
MENIAKENVCPNFVLIQTWRQIYSFCSQLHLDTTWKWAKVLHSLPWRKSHSQRMVNCHLIMFSKIQSHISFTFVTSWQWKRLIAELLSQRKQQTQISSSLSFNFHLVCCCWSSLLICCIGIARSRDLCDVLPLVLKIHYTPSTCMRAINP